jgi:hypothetical protein
VIYDKLNIPRDAHLKLVKGGKNIDRLMHQDAAAAVADEA